MLFGTKKTTATVLAGFQSTLDQLEEVAHANTMEAEAKHTEAQQALAAEQAALKEAHAATTVAGRIRALLSTVTEEGTGIIVGKEDDPTKTLGAGQVWQGAMGGA